MELITGNGKKIIIYFTSTLMVADPKLAIEENYKYFKTIEFGDNSIDVLGIKADNVAEIHDAFIKDVHEVDEKLVALFESKEFKKSEEFRQALNSLEKRWHMTNNYLLQFDSKIMHKIPTKDVLVKASEIIGAEVTFKNIVYFSRVLHIDQD